MSPPRRQTGAQRAHPLPDDLAAVYEAGETTPRPRGATPMGLPALQLPPTTAEAYGVPDLSMGGPAGGVVSGMVRYVVAAVFGGVTIVILLGLLVWLTNLGNAREKDLVGRLQHQHESALKVIDKNTAAFDGVRTELQKNTASNEELRRELSRDRGRKDR